MANNGPDVSQHIRDRASDLDTLTASEAYAINELQDIVQKNIDLVQVRQDLVITESNQYERQYTSFFGLAISFIIAGLLSSQPGIDSTLAARVFYLLTIVVASLAALFLFLEFIFASRHFDKWTKANNDIIDYINDGNWHNPNEISEWMEKRQAKVPEKSTRAIIITELVLVSLAFVLLTMWLYETLFNPDWPIL